MVTLNIKSPSNTTLEVPYSVTHYVNVFKCSSKFKPDTSEPEKKSNRGRKEN